MFEKAKDMDINMHFTMKEKFYGIIIVCLLCTDTGIRKLSFNGRYTVDGLSWLQLVLLYEPAPSLLSVCFEPCSNCRLDRTPFEVICVQTLAPVSHSTCLLAPYNNFTHLHATEIHQAMTIKSKVF